MTSIGKRWQRRKEWRPDEILAAAAEEVSEKGDGGLRIAAVAARAGVAKGTVYLYYPSKQHLLDALHDKCCDGRARCVDVSSADYPR